MSYVVSTVCGTHEQVLNPSCNVIWGFYSLWYTWTSSEPKLQCPTQFLQSVVHMNKFWTWVAMSYVVSTACGTHEQVLNPSCNVILIRSFYSLWYTRTSSEPKLQCHTWFLQSVVHMNKFWTEVAMSYEASTVCGTHEQVLNLSSNVIRGFYSLWYTWISFEPE